MEITCEPRLFILLLLLLHSNAAMEISSHCKEQFFECYDGVCLPQVWVCDGKEDCLHGEDEFCPQQDSSGGNSEKEIFKRDSILFNLQNERTELEDAAMELIREAKEKSERGFSVVLKTKMDNRKLKKRQNEPETTTATTTTTTTTDLEGLTETPTVSSFVSTSTETEQTRLSTEPSSVSPRSPRIDITFSPFDDSSTSTGDVDEVDTITTNPPSESSAESDPTNTNATPPSFLEDSKDETKDLLEKLISVMEKLGEIKELLATRKNMTEELDPKCFVTSPPPPSPTTTAATTLHKEHEPVTKLTCPYHFQYMYGLCIYVQIFPPMTWFEAMSVCSTHKGHLLTVESKELFEKLLKQLNYDQMRIYDLWIGATNQIEKGRWTWHNGKPITSFEIWGFNLIYGRPDLFLPYDSSNPLHCGFLDGKLHSYINHASCYEQKGFICQYGDKIFQY